MSDNNSLQSNDYYKNLNKHSNCSNCNIGLTQVNYKKGRTVCRVCYNNNVLRYYKNKFCSNPAPKSDVGTQTDFSDQLDSSNKQVKSRKQVKTKKQASSNKQVCSNKLDGSINLKNVDPDCLMEKFTELYNNKYENFEQSQPAREHCKEILAELLRVKAITKRDYNTLYKKCEK